MKKKERVILHCDMNNFFASCELLDKPHLKGIPVAVTGDPKRRRGIILAKNQEAKSKGVVTAETIWTAKKKCPELVLLPSNHEKYKKYSRLINSIYYRYTDMIEPFSIDESWLDVTGSRNIFGSGKEIADDIRATVKKELGLTLSVGVSYNKVFAKMGSEYKKPDATTVITHENFKALLWNKPVEELFFVGKATCIKLNKLGIKTIGDLAEAKDGVILKSLGKHGSTILKYARGEDDEPVASAKYGDDIKSIGNGVTFSRDITNLEEARTVIFQISHRVAERLRHKNKYAGGVKIDIKSTDFKTISRQKSISQPTDISFEIASIAFELLKKNWDFTKAIRLITVTAINITDQEESCQISFLDNSGLSEQERAQLESMDRAVDSIREKFGRSAIKTAASIKDEFGVERKEDVDEYDI